MGIRDWFTPRDKAPAWTIEPGGFRVTLPTRPLHPARLALQQLQEDDLASIDQDTAMLPWATVQRMAMDEQSEDLPPLLGLPPVGDVQPILVSTGTPGDSDFAIRIVAWRIHNRRIPASQVRLWPGAMLADGATYRLSPAISDLVALLDAQSGNPNDREGHFYLAAKAKALALAAGAELDTYLHQTDFLAVESPAVKLVTHDDGDEPAIEIVPHVEGAPDDFRRQFDRYDRVRPRYDVPSPQGGMAHIALSERAKQGFETVKATPSRRVAGEDAERLLRDPAAALGEPFQHLSGTSEWDEIVRKSGALPLQINVDIDDEKSAWVHLASIDGESPDQHYRLDAPDDAMSLLSRANAALMAHRQVLGWRGHRIHLDARGITELGRLAAWAAAATVDRVGLASSDVFDRSAYSERVAGFDGKPIHVPVMSRPGASGEWLKGVPQGIVSVHPATGEMTVVPVSDEDRETLRAAAQAARKAGKSHVDVPGVSEPLPVEVVENWLDSWSAQLQQGPRKIRRPEKPRPRNAPSLRILDNIDVLEFGQDVIPPPSDDTTAERPRALKPSVELKNHQITGLSTLQHRFRQRELGVTGLLLADDMGLGKTLQCLAFLAWYAETQPTPKTCLVVAPVSLLENWRSELRKFLDWPEDAVLSLYGPALQAERLRPGIFDPALADAGLRKLLRQGFESGRRLVLTTYETLRDYEFSFGRVNWGVLVCDEAQKIKNPSAQVTRSAKAMKADFKIACTGTPVENTLADYWCLFDFFQPGMLGSLSEFTQRFRKAIELREEGFEVQVDTLRRATKPLVLRRMKTDVADDLPPKIDAHHPDGHVVRADLPMSGLQTALYSETVGQFRALMDAKDRKREGVAILSMLHRLRMICSNPLLAKDPQLAGASIGEHRRANPKLDWTLDTLKRIQSRGEKAIVFTEFRDLQRLIQRAVMETFGIGVHIVNGDTDAVGGEDSRQALIDEFQQQPGFGVIVLSTTAVGFGVNVQAANHVIHFTRPWNPAKEDQATDRAYRIGQRKPVYVYTPTIVGQGFESYEQRVASRLSAKRALSRDMLAPEQMLTADDFRGL